MSFDYSKSGIQIYQRQGNEGYIRDTLIKCGLEFSEYNKKDKGKISIIRGKSYKTNNNTIVFYIMEKSAKIVRMIIKDKKIPLWTIKLSERQFGVLLEALIYGDGSKRSEKTYTYYSSDKKSMDRLQWLCSIFGYRTILNKRKYGAYELLICRKSTTQITKKNVQDIDYSGKVWCVNTNNGTVMVRRNGKVFITGNSHDCWSTKRVKMGYNGATTQLFVNTGTFLETATWGTTGYSEVKGYPPLKLGVVKITWEIKRNNKNKLTASE